MNYLCSECGYNPVYGHIETYPFHNDVLIVECFNCGNVLKIKRYVIVGYEIIKTNEKPQFTQNYFYDQFLQPN